MNIEVGQAERFRIMAKGQKSLVNFPQLDHSIENIQNKSINLHKQRWQVKLLLMLSSSTLLNGN
ncbi:MAG: hypothetical protein QNJ53_10325 [Pleurocapsa sp. MO_192.B19]|nr:hypothetical protein [Pleurocapsa sp. MO_192.B19]